MSRNAANWLHLERLRPVDDGRIVQNADGEAEFEITVRTPVDMMVRPICCLFQDLKQNGTKFQRYRHRRMQPMPTWLRVIRQKFECRSCGAALYEQMPDISVDRRMTKALEHEVFMSAIKRPFTDAAVFHQLTKATTQRIFLERARERLKDYEIRLPRVLGVDENRILGGDRFICMDIEAGTILDLLEDRSSDMLIQYFGRMPYHFNVEVFVQDMWRGYETVAKTLFPDAKVVIDKFHVVRYVNDAMTDARVAIQKKLKNEDRRWLKGKNKLFLVREHELNDKYPEGFDKLAEACERYPELKAAYVLKEGFYAIYDKPDRQAAEAAFEEWDRTMPKHLARFFRSVSRRVENWKAPIFNYFDARYTNGIVERMNRSLNEIVSRGFGYEFETFRLKAILRFGNVVPLADLAAFDLSAVPEEEWDELLNIAVVGGLDPATLERALKRGHF